MFYFVIKAWNLWEKFVPSNTLQPDQAVQDILNITALSQNVTYLGVLYRYYLGRTSYQYIQLCCSRSLGWLTQTLSDINLYDPWQIARILSPLVENQRRYRLCVCAFNWMFCLNICCLRPHSFRLFPIPSRLGLANQNNPSKSNLTIWIRQAIYNISNQSCKSLRLLLSGICFARLDR